MINKEVIKRHLKKLDEHLEILRGLREAEFKVFVEDFQAHGLAERYFNMATKSMLEIGDEIITGLGLKRQISHKDIFNTLAKQKVIPKEIVGTLIDLASTFKDVMEHDYLETKPEVVYNSLQKGVPNIQKFADSIRVLMD
jgi:uncharacterized protein YutE (UPF0331/DUF86 family)